MPIIFDSDATHLTNFSGDKKAWSVYMTIGNRSGVRQNPSLYDLALVAHLPVPLKFRKLRAPEHRAQQEQNNILRSVMAPLISPIDIETDGSFVALCANGNKHHVYPRLARWWPVTIRMHDDKLRTPNGRDDKMNARKGHDDVGNS